MRPRAVRWPPRSGRRSRLLDGVRAIGSRTAMAPSGPAFSRCPSG
ncbi:hypothetical protein [Lysobacter gummosus]